MKKYKFILSGGGTGGHIFPALSIAEKIIERFPECELLFVGAQGKMEMKIIPDQGYKINGLWISGFDRNNYFKNIILPLKIIVSFFQSIIIHLKFKPDLVIGTGGFASGPILFVSSLMKSYTMIQEQNSLPGITNKLLSKKVKKIFVAHNNMEKFFPKNKIIITGNPIRKSFFNLNESKKSCIDFFKLELSKKTIGIIGGSLGSERINQIIESIIPFLTKNNYQIIWQCGKVYYEEIKYLEKKSFIKIFPFINKMNYFYKASDIVISRSGAISISELSFFGKPCILIPSPNVSENHQFHNANYLRKIGGAEIFSENDPVSKIEFLIKKILDSKDIQLKMRRSLLDFSKPNASELIVDEIFKIIK